MGPTGEPIASLGEDVLPHSGVIDDELWPKFSLADKFARAEKEVAQTDAASDTFCCHSGYNGWRCRRIPFGWADCGVSR